jgi:hypothetical protein
LLVFNVKVKQFDFLCLLYLHIKTTPFWTPNFSTHLTQNDTILSIKIIYLKKKEKSSKIQKKKKRIMVAAATPWPKWGGWTTPFLV